MRTDISIDRKKVFCKNASELGFSQKTLYCGERFVFNDLTSATPQPRVGRMIGRISGCSENYDLVGNIAAIVLTNDFNLGERFVHPHDVIRTVHAMGGYDRSLEVVTEFLTLDVKKHPIHKIRHFISEGFPSLAKFDARHPYTHLVDYTDPATLKEIGK